MIRTFLFTWTIFLFFVFSQKAYAIYYNLTDEQIKEAIEYGENNKDTDYFTFLDEWMTVADDGYAWAALNTKFSILAYEAKQAALESRKLTQAEISRFPLEVDDILSFHVVLYGNSSDFAKDYHAVLLYKNKSIQPFTEQNDAHAKPANLGVRISTSYSQVSRLRVRIILLSERLNRFIMWNPMRKSSL